MAEQSKPQAIDMLSLKTQAEVLTALQSGKCDLEQANNRLRTMTEEAIRAATKPRVAEVNLEGGVTDGWMIIRLPLHSPTLSSQEKTYVCGSTGGQRKTEFKVNTPDGERVIRVTAMALAYREAR